MFSIVISILIFTIIGAISPGPVNIIATSSGANFGFQRTLPFVLGATVSYAIIAFFMGLGLNAFFKSYPQVTQILQYSASAFLLYMAYKIASTKAINPKNKNIAIARQKPPAFIDGALAQGLNPKAWLVSISGISLFVSGNSPAFLFLLIFCGISLVISMIGIGSWAAMGHMIGKLLSHEKHQRLFNIIMGLLLASTVIFIITAKL